MINFLIGLVLGALVGVIVVALCVAARGEEPLKKQPLIIKQERRVETLCTTLTAPKGSPDRTEELAHKLGRGLLTCGLIKIDRQEGMEWATVTGTVRVVVPEKEAER